MSRASQAGSALLTPPPAVTDLQADRLDALGTDLYLRQFGRVLTNLVHQDPPDRRPVRLGLYVYTADAEFDEVSRSLGEDWPSEAHTMSGLRRLDSRGRCVRDVVADDVPGDLVETGVWRGGSVVLMRGVLAALGVTDRTIWAADTYTGPPVPDPPNTEDNEVGWHALADLFAVGADEVRANLSRHGLDDEIVRLLPDRFRDTLGTAPIESVALLRPDSGTLEGGADALEHLWPRLSSGGYVVVSDYALPGPCAAVNAFPREHGIRSPLQPVDNASVLWRHDG